MANLFRNLTGVVALFAVASAYESMAYAQTSVIVEVRVLEVPRSETERMGGTIPKPGFVKSLSRDQANALAAATGSRIVHRIELPLSSGASGQVRLDSRIAAASTSSTAVHTYVDAGIGIDISPKVFQNRDISLSTGSQVRIRRGPDAEGATLLIFENPATRFDTRLQEGESIVLGGFISASERSTLPQMPALPDNPILNYLYPRTRLTPDRPDIAVLLTPRIEGPLINAAVDAPAVVGNPVDTSSKSASVPEPAVSPSANPVPAGIPMALAAVNPTTASASTIPVANFTVSSDSASSVSRPPTAPVVPVVTSSDVVTNSVASKPTVADRIAVVTSAPADVTPPVAGLSALSPVKSPPVSVAPTLVTNTQTEDILLFGGLGGKYTVQVGAFDRLEKAESLRSQLAKKYDMVFVEKSITGKTPYRVRVGRFPDRQAARQIEKKLADSGIETYLTTLN